MLKLYFLICFAIVAVSSKPADIEAPETPTAIEILAKKFDTWADNLKMDSDDLKERPFIKEWRDSLNKAVEELKNKIPSDIADMHEYADRVKKGTEELMGQLKTLSESDEAKRMKEFSMNMYKDAKSTLNDLKKKFE